MQFYLQQSVLRGKESMKIRARIQSVFSRPKVQQQLVTIFILVLIIPVSLCGILLYQSQKSLTRHYKEQTEADNLRVKC